MWSVAIRLPKRIGLRLRSYVRASKKRLLAGADFPTDFTLPALAHIPMLHHPGEAWLYGTCSDIQGILITRVSGQPLPAFLAERIFEPPSMVDAGCEVPAARHRRFASYDLAEFSDKIAILLTRLEAIGPVLPARMRDFWRYAAAV